MNKNWQKSEEVLKKGGVVVIPTDTIYGIVGSAFSKETVKRIYDLKERDKDKPFIVLISSLNDLKIFGVNLPLLRGSGQWPRGSVFKPKVTIILPCLSKKFKYLHRGKKSIAFRMISKKNKNLFHLLKKIGPLVAPSANLQDFKPALTIAQAKKYFNDKVDFYVNGGIKKSEPSTLVEYKNNKIKVLRQGIVKI